MMRWGTMRKFGVIVIVSLSFFATVAFAQTTYTTKDGYLAGITEEAFDKAVEYAVAKDYVALQQLMDYGLVIMLKPGLTVYVTDTKFFSGKVKIRPAGQTIELWTAIEAID